MMQGQNIICFANDWDADPTSKHQVMKILARSNRVLWVNSIGLRRPRATAHAPLPHAAQREAVAGGADMLSVVVRQPLVQLETPDAMRGRVSAVNALFIGTSNQIGEFRAGVAAHYFGTVPAVLMGGVGTLLIVALWIKAFPALYNMYSFQQRYK